jgi:hypothetical protein
MVISLYAGSRFYLDDRIYLSSLLSFYLRKVITMDGGTFAAASISTRKEMEALKKDIKEYDDKIKNGEKLSDEHKEQLQRWTKRLSDLTELSKEYVKVILFLTPFFIFFFSSDNDSFPNEGSPSTRARLGLHAQRSERSGPHL